MASYVRWGFRFLAGFLVVVALAGTCAAAPVSPASGVAVLVFHEVSPGQPGQRAVVSPAEFERILETLKGAGFNFLSLEEFHAYLEGRGFAPPKAVLVSFDDGYEGAYRYAHPILLHHRIPAVMFPVAKWFSPHPRPEPRARRHLTVSQAREMLASGLWAFGGHSYDGHREIATGPGRKGKFLVSRAWLGQRLETQREYEARVWADIVLMTWELRRLGVEPLDFAAPYGVVSPALEKLLSEAGYRYLYVQRNRLNYPGSTEVYRVEATAADQVLKDLELLFRDGR